MSLIGPNDPPIYELINAHSDAPVVLVCEHAGRAIPEKLDTLGVSRDAMDRHIAWDIGAAAVTRRMARILNAPAILQNYSRLVIDCNRPPEHHTAMPAVSDETPIPANVNLSHEARAERIGEIFAPFHAAASDLLDNPARKLTLAIHSFTPVLADIARPWDISFLFRHDSRTSQRMAAHVGADQPDLIIGMNQPYFVSDQSDWFVPRHGEGRGLAHSLVEIRNDHLLDESGQVFWAGILSRAATRYLKEF